MVSARSNLSSGTVKLKDLERSIRCFKKALIYNHRNADAKASIGMIHQERGSVSQAISAYSKALEFTDNNEHIQALFNQALEDNVSHYSSHYPLLGTSCAFSGSEPDEKHSVQDELGWDGTQDQDMSDQSSFENLELDSS
ncbi:hypothetical protein BY458DRAFT_240986 [Sporodiniella umbellata]|nr:hypothetical protein BY458DRAFT_240986 [Sporodiniella umbellata]